jgi:hypothetical protein
MADKHLKKCTTSLAIVEMQIKTTLRFHLTPVRMAKINNTSDSSRWQGCGARGTLLYAGGSANLYSYCGKQYRCSSQNWKSIFLKTIYIYIYKMFPLGTYLKDTLFYHTETYSTMFIVALFIIARNWKELRCSSTKEKINKM